jgi:hypothetical protein
LIRFLSSSLFFFLLLNEEPLCEFKDVFYKSTSGMKSWRKKSYRMFFVKLKSKIYSVSGASKSKILSMNCPSDADTGISEGIPYSEFASALLNSQFIADAPAQLNMIVMPMHNSKDPTTHDLNDFFMHLLFGGHI